MPKDCKLSSIISGMNKRIEHIVKQFLKCIGTIHANVLVIIILLLRVKQITRIFHILVVAILLNICNTLMF